MQPPHSAKGSQSFKFDQFSEDGGEDLKAKHSM